MPMALCFRYREAMTAGHDAVTFKGMIVKTVLMTACVVALVGCATPPGKLNAWEKFAQGKHQDVCK